METWFIVVVSLCVAALLRSALGLLSRNLPPGPLAVPVIGNLLWLRKPISDIELILRRLKPTLGPLITLTIGRRPFIFVSDHSLAHDALISNGAVFSDRPAPPPTSKVLGRTPVAISSSSYGPTWRLLRRNLTHEILHPSRVRLLSASRRWVLSLLLDRLLLDSQSVTLIDHFQYSMFCLLALMCFGNKLQEDQIKEIETVQRRLLLGFRRFNFLNTWPQFIGKILFRKRWNELIKIRLDQDRVLLPLIRARLHEDNKSAVAYVDTLADLHLPEANNRKLKEDEMVGLCSEFLSAGTDTTSTALQWIMANLVNQPDIQEKLYREIGTTVLNQNQEIVEEEELGKMPYLKAVVLEGLRRHPPGHFVLPHKVAKDGVELGGYAIPKDSVVNFMVADMGWDPEVWEDPMEFKPERFLSGEGEGLDVTGSREIKMMPFGAGRRICPASALAILHLEYFVANLIWRFHWTSPKGVDVVDLSEKQEFTIVMKNPLRACISPRIR